MSLEAVASMRWGFEPVLIGGRTGGLGAALSEWSETKAHEVSGLVLPHTHILSLQVSGPYNAELFLDGKRCFRKDARRSSACIVGAGRQPRAVHTGSGAILHLYIPDALIRDAAEADAHASKDIELLDPELQIDPTLARLGANIVAEMRAPGLGHALLMESYGAALAVHLVRQWSTARDRRLARSQRLVGSLAPWQTKRTIECIRDNLAHHFTLSELARAVGLSPFHFVRAFKSSVGVAPHRYLLERRIERARVLLATTTLSITDVGSQVGYDDPGYFSRIFRREVSLTPSRYRQVHRR